MLFKRGFRIQIPAGALENRSPGGVGKQYQNAFIGDLGGVFMQFGALYYRKYRLTVKEIIFRRKDQSSCETLGISIFLVYILN